MKWLFVVTLTVFIAFIDLPGYLKLVAAMIAAIVWLGFLT